MYQVLKRYREYVPDMNVLRLAIWFHHIVYLPGAKENEKVNSFSRSLLIRKVKNS